MSALARLGARAKWGPGYVPIKIRLDDLTLEQRRLVLALVAAARASKAARDAA
jgi:hypothetical protein